MNDFKCIVCTKALGEDHRWCLVRLFKEKQINSVEDWEKASRNGCFVRPCDKDNEPVPRVQHTEDVPPATLRKGRIRARVPRE